MPRLTSWEGTIGSYLESLRQRAYSQETIATRRLTLHRFARHLLRRRVLDVRRVSQAHLSGWAHKLARAKTRYGRPCTILTQRTCLTIVRHFFAFLVKRKLILCDPTQDLALPRVHSLPRHVPTEAQARRLMSAPDQTRLGLRDRAMLELLYGSGLRASELRRLDLTHLDLDKGLVLVRRGKGAKDRTVPLSGRSIEALAAYLKDGRPLLAKKTRELALFLSQAGRRLGKNGFQARIKQHVQAAKLAPSTVPHSLRHACATHLLQGGANLRHVQAILGHAHLQSTTIYTRVTVKDLAKVLERAHPREREWARRARKA